MGGCSVASCVVLMVAAEQSALSVGHIMLKFNASSLDTLQTWMADSFFFFGWIKTFINQTQTITSPPVITGTKSQRENNKPPNTLHNL